MTAVTPIAGLARRVPVVAKLKNGATTKNGQPRSIETWRITTSSREFADDFAAKYGGTVERMTNKNSPHEWEVTSESTEVAIALIPDGHYEAYELWSAGGCQRRCDGVTASVIQTTGPDDVEYVDAPCLCDRKGVLECSLKSRLTMILPDLPFRGGVVYETSSQNFAAESKGMLALLEQLQSSGIQRGVLRLEKRKSSGGRRYTLAVVGVNESLEALASGAAGMGALGQAPEDNRPELAAGGSPAPVASRGVEVPPSSAPHPSSTAPLVEQVDAGPERSPRGSQSADTGPATSSPGVEEGEALASGEAMAGGRQARHLPVKETHAGSSPAPPAEDEDIVDAEIVDDGPDERGDPSERANLNAAFHGIIQGAGLKYDDQVRPFLEHHYGTSLSGLPIDKFRQLVGKLNDGSQAEKQDARKRFKVAVLEHAEVQS